MIGALASNITAKPAIAPKAEESAAAIARMSRLGPRGPDRASTWTKSDPPGRSSANTAPSCPRSKPRLPSLAHLRIISDNASTMHPMVLHLCAEKVHPMCFLALCLLAVGQHHHHQHRQWQRLGGPWEGRSWAKGCCPPEPPPRGQPERRGRRVRERSVSATSVYYHTDVV
jgi:hypothetical protein